jgi:phosphoserine phosphatase RsbU/P
MQLTNNTVFELETLKKAYQTLLNENQRLKKERETLKEDVSDLQIMYDGSIEHGVAMENLLAEKNGELEKTQQRLQEELRQASNYLYSQFPKPSTERGIRSEWTYISSTEIGGDAFGYHWIDDDHFALYLLDVCGHGVGAALLSSTVIQIIKSQSLADVNFRDPAKVLNGLNDTFQMDEQNHMFFTLWYGVFKRSTRCLSYASAGHPPAILLSRAQDGSVVVEKLATQQIIMGYSKDVSYQVATCQVPTKADLFIFSDGVFEIDSEADKRMWAFDDFEVFMRQQFTQKKAELPTIIKQLQTIQGHESFADDVSIMKLTFS